MASGADQIDLADVPKSDEILFHISLADKLSKETFKEHGFRFCKPADKIIVDKLCVGSSCEIDISPEKCGEYDYSFHTHPFGRESIPSIADIYATAYESYLSHTPSISCVKAVRDEEVFCDNINMRHNKYKMKAVRGIIHEFNKNPTQRRHDKMSLDIYMVTRGRQLMFDSKTGEVTMDVYL